MPTNSPSSGPTYAPSSGPTYAPSHDPTSSPTMHPTRHPSGSPHKFVTGDCYCTPLAESPPPTSKPSSSPSHDPTPIPTPRPSATPTPAPSGFQWGYEAHNGPELWARNKNPVCAGKHLVDYHVHAHVHRSHLPLHLDASVLQVRMQGHRDWCECHGCLTGKQQSPINVNTKTVHTGKIPNQLNIRFVKTLSNTLSIENNGHTVKVTGSGLKNDSTTIDGTKFQLLQFHFHHASEHRIDGVQFPFEGQFVHKSAAGKYMIVSVLFRTGEANPVLEGLQLNEVKYEGQTTFNPVALNLMKMLPKDWTEFYYYQGSFTSPPCTEGVDWVVLKTSATVSPSALAEFPFKDNFRPPQPLYGRKIVLSSTVARSKRTWGYDGAGITHGHGPETWAQINDACAGKHQSPIDIKTNNVQSGYSNDLSMKYFEAAYGTLLIENTGSSIRLHGEGLKNDIAFLRGHKYSLRAIEFHHSSEHRVNSEQFPLEAQFFHQDHDGNYLVVSVLFHTGVENRVIRKLSWGGLQDEGKLHLYTTINPSQLLPENHKEFYYYKGSLTTPPCTEHVKWIVMKYHPTVSLWAVREFPFKHNFRPPQPMNGRKIVMSSSRVGGKNKWGYEEFDGPATWAEKFSACAGDEQSPINIAKMSVVPGMRSDFSIHMKRAIAGSLTVSNNGHTIQVAGTGLSGDSVTLGGKKYNLLQFHFHHASETRVENEQFPLEAQFVFQSQEGKYLVLAVLFRTGVENRILSALDFGKHFDEGSTKLAEAINPLGLFPASTKHFFFYQGSLTTPPCTEGVQWVVLKKYSSVAPSTVRTFPLKHNFRPPQPLNGRYVVDSSSRPTPAPTFVPTRLPTAQPTHSPTPAATGITWSLALAKGSYGSRDVGATAFNRQFWLSPHKIVKRVCSLCSSEYRVIYYRRYTHVTSFAVYDYLKQNWRSSNNQLNSDFGIFSTYEDALAKRHPWKFCNYNHAGVGFPRDCGKTKAIGGQWNSWTRGSKDVAFYIESAVKRDPVSCNKLSSLSENNFNNRGDSTLKTSSIYTYRTSCGYKVKLSGWTHTRRYAKGFLRNTPGTGRAVVEGLKAGRIYDYKIYQYASHYAGSNAYQVNGKAKGSTKSRASDAATATGKAVANSAGKVTFTFTRQAHHVHLSGIAIAEAKEAEFSTVAVAPNQFVKKTGGVHFEGNEVRVNQGNYFADTKQTFTRPADMSIQLHQWGGGSECGVVSLFPQHKARHSGYNAGTGWWGRYFGAGKDGSIGKRGSIPDNNANRWNTVRINARADGWVDFYLNGAPRYKIKDNRYTSGVVRIGYGCRRFRFRNLRVKQQIGRKPTRVTKYTSAWGGNGGGAISSFCRDGKFINLWKIRSGVRSLLI